MHDPEKSDPGIAMKATNKVGATGGGAGRAKAGDQRERGTVAHTPDPGPGTCDPGARPRTASRKAEEEGTVHRAPPPYTLRMAFYALKRKAAPGVDGMTWEDYEADLELRIEDLHGRVHRGAYRPQPSRRVYIDKADGKQRPLSIAALEDKIVQGATVMVLNAIYEGDFVGFSYGFRPGRGPHDALDALSTAIKIRKVNWILDADIQNFFGSVSREWLIRFLEHRIGDKRIIRLIQKWLRAGILEDGLHLHLWSISPRQLPASTEDPARPHAGKAEVNPQSLRHTRNTRARVATDRTSGRVFEGNSVVVRSG